jgi:hypothetical protein
MSASDNTSLETKFTSIPSGRERVRRPGATAAIRGTAATLLKDKAIERIGALLGPPVRVRKKVTAFALNPDVGIVVQTDAPNKEDAAFVWLPYPQDGESVPEMALEYAAESGRHSGTYASAGLERNKPALKLILRTEKELEELVSYVAALRERAPLPRVSIDRPIPPEVGASGGPLGVDPATMPRAAEPKRRREAIPRHVQREVWQRDAGRCVECDSKEFLCFDHIVPFSRGGSNTVRNIQLLCEACNLSKGNRI